MHFYVSPFNLLPLKILEIYFLRNLRQGIFKMIGICHGKNLLAVTNHWDFMSATTWFKIPLKCFVHWLQNFMIDHAHFLLSTQSVFVSTFNDSFRKIATLLDAAGYYHSIPWDNLITVHRQLLVRSWNALFETEKNSTIFFFFCTWLAKKTQIIKKSCKKTLIMDTQSLE